MAFRCVRPAGAAYSVQSHELRLRTDPHPPPRVCTRLLCMHGTGRVGLYYLGYAGREAASGQAGVIGKALLALALLAAVAFLPRLVRGLKGGRFTDPATLKRRLESGEQVALTDVRTAEEFQGPLGHVAGARSIPIAELSAKILELTEIKRKLITTI